MNKKNGNEDMDSPQMKEMRQAVIEQELSARSWRAYYEKMYFSMEAEKLEAPYKEHQERLRKRLEEDKKKMEEFMKTLQDTNVSDQKGSLKVVANEKNDTPLPEGGTHGNK